jgi:hypothetical protein
MRVSKRSATHLQAVRENIGTSQPHPDKTFLVQRPTFDERCYPQLQNLSFSRAIQAYSTFLIASRRFGAVVMDSLFFSMSAAHSAAPTKQVSRCPQTRTSPYVPVLVNEKKIEATGTSSRRVATVPNLRSRK